MKVLKIGLKLIFPFHLFLANDFTIFIRAVRTTQCTDINAHFGAGTHKHSGKHQNINKKLSIAFAWLQRQVLYI